MFLLSVQYSSRQVDNMTYMSNVRYTYGTMNYMNLCMIYVILYFLIYRT